MINFRGSKQFWVDIWVDTCFSNCHKTSIHAAFKTRFDSRRRLKRANAVLPDSNILGRHFIHPSFMPENKTDRSINTKTDRQRQVKKYPLFENGNLIFKSYNPV